MQTDGLSKRRFLFVEKIKIEEEQSMNDSECGNFLSLSMDEIIEGIAMFRKEHKNTKSKIMSDQYLTHAEYREGVLQKMQRQKAPSLFICL